MTEQEVKTKDPSGSLLARGRYGNEGRFPLSTCGALGGGWLEREGVGLGLFSFKSWVGKRHCGCHRPHPALFGTNSPSDPFSHFGKDGWKGEGRGFVSDRPSTVPLGSTVADPLPVVTLTPFSPFPTRVRPF